MAIRGLALALLLVLVSASASNWLLRRKFARILDRRSDGSLSRRFRVESPLELPFSVAEAEMCVGELAVPVQRLLAVHWRPEYASSVCELSFEGIQLAISRRIPVFPCDDETIASLTWRSRLLSPSFGGWLRRMKGKTSVHGVLAALLTDDCPLRYGRCPVRNAVIQQAIKRSVLPAFTPSRLRRFANDSGLEGILVVSDLGTFAHLAGPTGMEYVLYSPRGEGGETAAGLLSQVHWVADGPPDGVEAGPGGAGEGGNREPGAQ